MSTNQIQLYSLAVLTCLGLFFLGWTFYNLCIDSRRSRRRVRGHTVSPFHLDDPSRSSHVRRRS